MTAPSGTCGCRLTTCRPPRFRTSCAHQGAGYGGVGLGRSLWDAADASTGSQDNESPRATVLGGSGRVLSEQASDMWTQFSSSLRNGFVSFNASMKKLLVTIACLLSAFAVACSGDSESAPSTNATARPEVHGHGRGDGYACADRDAGAAHGDAGAADPRTDAGASYAGATAARPGGATTHRPAGAE